MRFVKGSKPMPPPWCNMSEPEPEYTPTLKGQYDFTDAEAGNLEHVERKLIDALKAIWRLQGKQRKIIKLN